VTGLLAVIMGNFGFGESKEYHDAPATGTPLKDGATLPVSQTTPALDLTTLFNGFQPLFQALSPKQVNELSMNLVQVLQGEGGTIQELLASTASLTNSLADRDQLIGEVVTNLTATLDTVDQRHQELNTLVSQLQRWMSDLARDRTTIGGSLDSISDLTVVVADLLREGRPLLKDDVVELKKLAKLLNRPENQQQVVELLDRLPESMTDQTRTGTYGSWYNYYVCGFSGRITLPGNLGTIPGLQQVLDGLGNLNFHSTAPRCNGAAEAPSTEGAQ
jgi:phospholipid/cholesterol/gamma-HCH transport system substrate-binding protein